MNLVMRGWGAEGRSRQNVGSLAEGLPGTFGGAGGSAVWNPRVLELYNWGPGIVDGQDNVRMRGIVWNANPGSWKGRSR